jgi:hypothetical protein
MDINLKLKKRRELIERQKSYQRTKVIRQYKQQVANDNDLDINLKDTNDKMEEFKKREEKRLKDEKKLLGEDINESDNEIKKEDSKIKIKKEEKKLIGNKRSREEIEIERQKKINKRKKNYRNLHRTNKFGQPLMKYQIQNIFDKIKKKKRDGII